MIARRLWHPVISAFLCIPLLPGGLSSYRHATLRDLTGFCWGFILLWSFCKSVEIMAGMARAPTVPTGSTFQARRSCRALSQAAKQSSAPGKQEQPHAKEQAMSGKPTKRGPGRRHPMPQRKANRQQCEIAQWITAMCCFNGIPRPPRRHHHACGSAISGQVIPNVLINGPPRLWSPAAQASQRRRGGGRFGEYLYWCAVSFWQRRARAATALTGPRPWAPTQFQPSPLASSPPPRHWSMRKRKKTRGSRSRNASPAPGHVFRRHPATMLAGNAAT